MNGTLIAVVGFSGVGKDCIIAGVVAARSEPLSGFGAPLPGPSGTETFEGLTPDTFEAPARAGSVCVDWDAVAAERDGSDA